MTLPLFETGRSGIGTLFKAIRAAVAVDDDTKRVYFFEEGQGPSGFADAMPSGGVAKTTWTPSRPGITYIYAVQPDAWPETRQVVDVGTGIDLGSACVAV